jgi:hypothetical protein
LHTDRTRVGIVRTDKRLERARHLSILVSKRTQQLSGRALLLLQPEQSHGRILSLAGIRQILRSDGGRLAAHRRGDFNCRHSWSQRHGAEAEAATVFDEVGNEGAGLAEPRPAALRAVVGLVWRALLLWLTLLLLLTLASWLA